MRNIIVAFYKETYSWLIAAISSISILFYSKEISTLLHLERAKGFIFVPALILLIVCIVNCIAAFFRLLWEKWLSLSNPADLYKTSSEIKLKPSRVQSILMLFVGLMFLSLATYMILNPSKPSHLLSGWFGVIFSGAIIVWAVVLLLVPRASFLKINPEGIQICSLWRTTTISWYDIEEFGVAAFSTYYRGIHQKYSNVGIKFSQICNHKVNRQWEWGRKFSKELVGYEFTLPDNYGMRSEDLAELLNYKRKQYTRT